MSFFVVKFPLLKKDINPGIYRDSSQFCSVIPEYGKTSKNINPQCALCTQSSLSRKMIAIVSPKLLFKLKNPYSCYFTTYTKQAKACGVAAAPHLILILPKSNLVNLQCYIYIMTEERISISRRQLLIELHVDCEILTVTFGIV